MHGVKDGGEENSWPWSRGISKNDAVGGAFGHNQWAC